MRNLILLVSVLVAMGLSKLEARAKCNSGNCINGQGEATYTNGKYKRTFKNSYFEGKGSYNWNDGNVYEGEFKKGELAGVGNFQIENEAVVPDNSVNAIVMDVDKEGTREANKGIVEKTLDLFTGGDKKDSDKDKTADKDSGKSGDKSAKGDDSASQGKDGRFKVGKFKVVKSIFIPGWTQYENQEKIKAPANIMIQ